MSKFGFCSFCVRNIYIWHSSLAMTIFAFMLFVIQHKKLDECCLGYDSVLWGYTGPGTTWTNETNFVMKHAPGAGSIVWPVDQQSSAITELQMPPPLAHFKINWFVGTFPIHTSLHSQIVIHQIMLSAMTYEPGFNLFIVRTTIDTANTIGERTDLITPNV